MKDDIPRIHWLIALVPFAVLVLLQVLVIKQFGSDAIDGASQTALLFSAAVAIAIAMVGYKVSWKTINGAIGDNIKTIGPAVLILFLIGAISGSWMMSGVVPTMIYYGMKVITPSLFLFMACLICALVSLITGSSWTTVATVGIALIGIGTAHGFSAGWTAGAIISGAYFGDKISPLSDTTVLASSVGEVPLGKHIRYMLITTVPEPFGRKWHSGGFFCRRTAKQLCHQSMATAGSAFYCYSHCFATACCCHFVLICLGCGNGYAGGPTPHRDSNRRGQQFSGFDAHLL